MKNVLSTILNVLLEIPRLRKLNGRIEILCIRNFICRQVAVVCQKIATSCPLTFWTH